MAALTDNREFIYNACVKVIPRSAPWGGVNPEANFTHKCDRLQSQVNEIHSLPAHKDTLLDCVPCPINPLADPSAISVNLCSYFGAVFREKFAKIIGWKYRICY